jgi:hypothetical protein
MNSVFSRRTFAYALAAVIAGCAGIPLGGGGLAPFDTVALTVPAGTPAAQVAQQVKDAGGDLVLVFANADSAWYSELAKTTGLQLSRSRKVDQGTIAFLAGKPVGDTTLTVAVQGGSPLLIHDALYEVEKDRFVDLMAVRAEAGTPAREAVRALLGYLGSDVMGTASLVLTVKAGSQPLSDSIATLLRPVLMDVRDCDKEGGSTAPPRSDLLLFYGPEARMECREVRALTGPGSPIFARLAIPPR